MVAGAPIESVWRVIADVTRTGEWSHECHHVAWLGGATAAVPGARFRGRNRSGWLRWSRRCEVLAVDAPRQLSWRTIPTVLFADSGDWRIGLEPADTGTRIVQAFQLTKFPRWWEWIVAWANPRHLAVWLRRTTSDRSPRGELAEPYRLEVVGEWGRSRPGMGRPGLPV